MYDPGPTPGESDSGEDAPVDVAAPTSKRPLQTYVESVGGIVPYSAATVAAISQLAGWLNGPASSAGYQFAMRMLGLPHVADAAATVYANLPPDAKAVWDGWIDLYYERLRAEAVAWATANPEAYAELQAEAIRVCEATTGGRCYGDGREYQAENPISWDWEGLDFGDIADLFPKPPSVPSWLKWVGLILGGFILYRAVK